MLPHVYSLQNLRDYGNELYQNRLMESMELYKSVCMNRYFRTASIILFLNKIDLFAQKIKTVPITTLFKEFKGTINRGLSPQRSLHTDITLLSHGAHVIRGVRNLDLALQLRNFLCVRNTLRTPDVPALQMQIHRRMNLSPNSRTHGAFPAPSLTQATRRPTRLASSG